MKTTNKIIQIQTHLCKFFFLQELQGIKVIVGYLHSLPQNKKNVPDLIKDPIALIKDVRTLVEQHRHDNHQLATTGRPILLSMADKRKVFI